MLGKAFGFEPEHRIRDLASLSLIFPSYRRPMASTDVPVMMFVDAAAVHGLHYDVAAIVVAVGFIHQIHVRYGLILIANHSLLCKLV